MREVKHAIQEAEYEPTESLIVESILMQDEMDMLNFGQKAYPTSIRSSFIGQGNHLAKTEIITDPL